MNKEETLRFLDRPVLPIFANLLSQIRESIYKSPCIESYFVSEDRRSGEYFGYLYRYRREKLNQTGKDIPIGMDDSIEVFFDNKNQLYSGGYVKFGLNTAFILISEPGWISAIILFKEKGVDT